MRRRVRAARRLLSLAAAARRLRTRPGPALELNVCAPLSTARAEKTMKAWLRFVGHRMRHALLLRARARPQARPSCTGLAGRKRRRPPAWRRAALGDSLDDRRARRDARRGGRAARRARARRPRSRQLPLLGECAVRCAARGRRSAATPRRSATQRCARRLESSCVCRCRCVWSCRSCVKKNYKTYQSDTAHRGTGRRPARVLACAREISSDRALVCDPLRARGCARRCGLRASQ